MREEGKDFSSYVNRHVNYAFVCHVASVRCQNPVQSSNKLLGLPNAVSNLLILNLGVFWEIYGYFFCLS
jgi:hypothetical protein